MSDTGAQYGDPAPRWDTREEAQAHIDRMVRDGLEGSFWRPVEFEDTEENLAMTCVLPTMDTTGLA